MNKLGSIYSGGIECSFALGQRRDNFWTNSYEKRQETLWRLYNYCFTQVNRRKRHLQYLLKSLSDASNIQNTLLIFSHDYFDEAINNVIKAIDFGPYIQIFYPLPIQLYPLEFPGDDPNDW